MYGTMMDTASGEPGSKLQILKLLCFASIMGVVGATTSACVIGLAIGTSTWCGVHLAWPVGFVLAIPCAVLFGFPAQFIYRKLGLTRWWQFVIGGVVIAIPIWESFAQPFSSARWLQSGFFDSLIFLGSGAFAAIVFWFLDRRRNARDDQKTTKTDARFL